jgi:hypothetical protein
MLHPRFAYSIDLLGCRFLILGFQFFFGLFIRKSDDLSTSLGRRTLPIMHTPLTKLSIGDPVVSLPAPGICSHITQLVSLGTPITILLFVVTEVALAEGLLFLV